MHGLFKRSDYRTVSLYFHIDFRFPNFDRLKCCRDEEKASKALCTFEYCNTSWKKTGCVSFNNGVNSVETRMGVLNHSMSRSMHLLYSDFFHFLQ